MSPQGLASLAPYPGMGFLPCPLVYAGRRRERIGPGRRALILAGVALVLLRGRPTCLAVFPISKVSKISEAHIVPDAAGGSLKTYICTRLESSGTCC